MYSEMWDEAPVNPWCGEIYRLRSSHAVLQGFEACVCELHWATGARDRKDVACSKKTVSPGSSGESSFLCRWRKAGQSSSRFGPKSSDDCSFWHNPTRSFRAYIPGCVQAISTWMFCQQLKLNMLKAEFCFPHKASHLPKASSFTAETQRLRARLLDCYFLWPFSGPSLATSNSLPLNTSYTFHWMAFLSHPPGCGPLPPCTWSLEVATTAPNWALPSTGTTYTFCPHVFTIYRKWVWWSIHSSRRKESIVDTDERAVGSLGEFDLEGESEFAVNSSSAMS